MTTLPQLENQLRQLASVRSLWMDHESRTIWLVPSRPLHGPHPAVEVLTKANLRPAVRLRLIDRLPLTEDGHIDGQALRAHMVQDESESRFLHLYELLTQRPRRFSNVGPVGISRTDVVHSKGPWAQVKGADLCMPQARRHAG